MDREEYIENLLDVIHKKYKVYLFNEGEMPNLITLSPKMCDTLINYFQLQEFTTIFGMKILISSEVDDFNKIGIYRIERPDEWKNII